MSKKEVGVKMFKYCYVVQTDVEILDGQCKKQFGAPTKRYTCPYKNSLVCPEKELVSVIVMKCEASNKRNE